MQVHHDEGVANRIDPESCADTREGIGEALTGERAGRPLSRDRLLQRGADVVELHGRQHGGVRYCEHPSGPRVVVDPGMHGRSLRGIRSMSLTIRPNELALVTLRPSMTQL